MKWNELSKKARERFLSSWHDDFFAQPIVDYYTGDYPDPSLAARGFDIDHVHYNGFYSQGDGASWEGRVYLEPFIKAHLTDEKGETVAREILLAMRENGDISGYIEVSCSGYYSHSGTMRADGLVTYFAEHTIMDAKALTDSPWYGALTQTLYDAIGGDLFLDDLSGRMLSEAKELADTIYKELEEAFEYAHSEENVKELAEINDWEFDEQGNLL